MVDVLLIMDQPCFLLGFRQVMEADPKKEIRAVGHARTLSGGLDLACSMHPDVVVLDISVPGCGSEDLARCRAEGRLDFNLLALSPLNQKFLVQQAFASGVKGYLLKSAEGEEIVHALHTVAKGGTYLDPSLVSGLVGAKALSELPNVSQAFGHFTAISAREIDVLKHTALGYSAKEIARELNISQKSVETYKARAAMKLGLGSRVDIVRFASLCGWFSSSH